jgi:hypothetical protein
VDLICIGTKIGHITLNWQEWRDSFTSAGGYTVTKFKEFRWNKGSLVPGFGFNLQIGAGTFSFGTHSFTHDNFFAWVEGRSVQPNWIAHDASDRPGTGTINEPSYVQFTAAAGEALTMSINYVEPVTDGSGGLVGSVSVSESFNAPYSVAAPPTP